MKAIETYYNGYRFRSRLEARVAKLLEGLEIKYEYEPEGFVLSDGTHYLPDFYLPESRSWLEVKGVMDDRSEHKINLFTNEGNLATVMFPDFSFKSSNQFGDNEPAPLSSEDESWLCECLNCGRKYFIGNIGIWSCPCCGYHDGDHGFIVLTSGDNKYSFYYKGHDLFKEARDKARQARFEFDR